MKTKQKYLMIKKSNRNSKLLQNDWLISIKEVIDLFVLCSYFLWCCFLPHMFYIRILFGRDLSTKVHLNCAMENIYVMYLKDKGYMIFGIMWYSHWIAWLIMLYIVYLFSLITICYSFIFCMYFEHLFDSMLLVYVSNDKKLASNYCD